MHAQSGNHAGTERLRRSLLFVPGAEPRKLEKARGAGADTLLFDLEDAVAPEAKVRAREHVAGALQEGNFGASEPAVRVNAPGTDWFAEDLDAVVRAGARAVMIPKCESASGVAEVARVLAGIEGGAAIALLALVETPAGVTRLLEVAGQVRVGALCFGHVDFSHAMGLAAADAGRGVVHHARCAVAIAGRACDVSPIDTVCLAVRDEAAFRADAELGRQLGFDGKLCIHPLQVKLANEVYTPTPDEITHARRVTQAAEQARAEGRGVFSIDDRMVDAPVVAAQERVLERARRAGLLP